jgi:hypothetical protein
MADRSVCLKIIKGGKICLTMKTAADRGDEDFNNAVAKR